MTKKEIIYNALGMIEGAVCVSQKNTRDVLMKAVHMIKDAVEEETDCEVCCDHQWDLKETNEFLNDFGEIIRCGKFVCRYCGEKETMNI